MAEEAFYQRSDPKKGDIFHQDLKAIGMTEAVDFWTEGERGYVPKEGEHI